MNRTKDQIPWVSSHDLYWENKMYKRKRSTFSDGEQLEEIFSMFWSADAARQSIAKYNFLFCQNSQFYIQLGLFNIACYYILFSQRNKVRSVMN